MPMEESAMIELIQNMVTDNLGKEWACSLEVEKGTVTVYIEGYSKQYPLILSQDNTFIKNVNKKLKKLGFNEMLKPKVKDFNDTVVFDLMPSK